MADELNRFGIDVLDERHLLAAVRKAGRQDKRVS